MKFGIKGLLATAVAASALVLAGCGDKQDNANKIKVGVMAGAEAQVAEVAAKVAKEKYGLEVELVTFSDYVTPNAALDDGSIDVNAFQHKPYLDQQIKDRGYKLSIAGNTFVYPIAGYSKKVKSVDEIIKGDRIAVPNDPTNLGRSLLLLEQQGIIKLREGVGLLATVRDITENPKNVTLVELDAAQLASPLDDVALSDQYNVCQLYQANTAKDGIFVEDKESPYVNLVVAREDNVNAENVQNFIKSYQTEEVSAAIRFSKAA